MQKFDQKYIGHCKKDTRLFKNHKREPELECKASRPDDISILNIWES